MKDQLVAYHYCDLDTFLSIIKNKQLFLSDPLKMNDELEAKWYLQILNESDSGNDSILQRMRERSGINFTYDDFLNALNERGQNNVFIACFSRNRDSLGQWRGYAKDGTGVAIGFDLEKLAVAYNLYINEIEYCDQLIMEEEERVEEVVADTIQTVFSEYGVPKQDEIEIFINELMPILVRYKNPSFKEEEEIRLIYEDKPLFDKLLDKWNAFEEPVSFKELSLDYRVINGSDITRYATLNLSNQSFTELIIGPKCKVNISEAKNLIKKYWKEDISISKSKSSYR